MSSVTFQTKLTSQNGNLKFNIYDYSLGADFSVDFYILHKRKFKPASYQPLNIQLNLGGDIMNLSRKITTDKIMEVINTRNAEESVNSVSDSSAAVVNRNPNP